MTGKPIWNYPAEFRAPPGEGCKTCGIILKEDQVLEKYCSAECAEFKDRCSTCDRGPSWCECVISHEVDPTLIYVLQNDSGAVLHWYATEAEVKDAFVKTNLASQTWQSIYFDTFLEGQGTAAFGEFRNYSEVKPFLEKAREAIGDPFWNPNDFPDDGYPEYKPFPVKLGTTDKNKLHELAERLCEKWGEMFEETK